MTKIQTIISPIEQIGIIILVCLVSLTCLVSCGGSGSDDDMLPTPQPETTVKGGDNMIPITFSGSETEEKSVTRAGGTPLSNLVKSFKVWGHKNMNYDDGTGAYSEMQTVFQGYTVNWYANSAATSSSNTNNWEYILTGYPNQTIKYWDWSAKAYRFFGATNWKAEGPYEYNDAYGADGTYEAGTYKTYDVNMLVDASPVLDGKSKYDVEATATKLAAVPYFSHLWFSTGKVPEYADKQFGNPVTLEFLKPFARVRFIFKYVYPREGIKLTSISFKPSDGTKNIARKGTVTISYPLNGTKTEEWFSISDVDAGADLIDFTEDYDPEDDGKEYIETDNGWYTVLPNDEQGSYTMSVYINDPTKASPPKTAVVPATYMQWLPGYSYTYIFKITDEGGVEIGGVEYAVIKWVEQEATHPVYNW